MKPQKESLWPWGPRVQVIEHDSSGLIAVHKPAGVLSHPNRPGATQRAAVTLDYHPEREAYSDSEGRELFLCNRLDSPTSGVLLFAESERLSEQVRRAFEEHRVEKTYVALVKGRPRPDLQTWKDNLARGREQGRLRVTPGRSGSTPAITRIQREASWRLGAVMVSRLKLFPETGRTHQLRVQTAHRGFPILGDKTYGDFLMNRNVLAAMDDKRLFLHAASIKLNFKFAGKTIHFEASSPIPSPFFPNTPQ